MTDLFDNPSAFTPFEEDVVVHAAAADGGTVIDATIPAAVVIGTGMSSSAGAQGYSETADRYSLVIRKEAWPFAYPPRFGMAFDLRNGTHLTAAQAQDSVGIWTVRCTANQMEYDR